MTTPSDANKTNPTVFIVTPGPTVAGSPVDDLEIDVGPSDVNNTAPAAFPLKVVVPKADVVPQPDGNWHVPFTDVVKSMMADGIYGARCESMSGTKISAGSSPLVFFNLVSPPPANPTAFTVA